MEHDTAAVNAEASTSAAAPPSAVDVIVEGWWEDHFPGSPVAQLTQAWNHALAAKEELKRRLADFVANPHKGVH